MEGSHTVFHFCRCFFRAVRLQVDSLERIQHPVYAEIILRANHCSCPGVNIGQVLGGIRVVLAYIQDIIDAVFHSKVRHTEKKMHNKLEILNIGTDRMARNYRIANGHDNTNSLPGSYLCIAFSFYRKGLVTVD